MTVAPRVAARRAGVVVLASALFLASCGGSKQSTSTTTAPEETSAPDGSDTTAASSGASGAVGSFGDLSAVCGPGSAKGATDQGVTDTEIVVGTMADPGNTIIPGLNQELFDAADAFVGWCNDAGGIRPRRPQVGQALNAVTSTRPCGRPARGGRPY